MYMMIWRCMGSSPIGAERMRPAECCALLLGNLLNVNCRTIRIGDHAVDRGVILETEPGHEADDDIVTIDLALPVPLQRPGEGDGSGRLGENAFLPGQA